MTKDRETPSLHTQALAVWAIGDGAMRHAKPQERGGLEPLAFSRALRAAKVTMNLIAADPDLCERVSRKLAELELQKRLSA